MKKAFLSVGIMVGSLAMAQMSPTFGIKAGGNLSSINNSDFKSKIGFYGGLFMNAPLSSEFSIQPEVIYSQQGAKFNSSTGENLGKANFDYINVPIMFQYNVAQQFYLEAGPQFGFLTSAKGKDTDGKEVVDFKDEMKSFDLGVGLGAGYKITPNLGINARYTAGITSLMKDVPEGDTQKFRNNVFQLGLGYSF